MRKKRTRISMLTQIARVTAANMVMQIITQMMVVLLVPGLFLVQTTNVNNHDVYANNN